VYQSNAWDTIYLNFESYYELNKRYIKLTNISNHCINTCIQPDEKKKVSDLDKIESPTPQTQAEHFITIKDSKEI
jgi:hypothetical protein